jgi:hypothetical protein
VAMGRQLRREAGNKLMTVSAEHNTTRTSQVSRWANKREPTKQIGVFIFIKGRRGQTRMGKVQARRE